MIAKRMIAPTLLVCCLLLLLAGCKVNSQDRLHQNLVEARADRTALLDGLYGEYGGGTLAKSIEGEAASGDSGGEGEAGVMDMFKGIVSEGDRAAFEGQVEVVGNGERLVAFSKKAKAFFAREDVKKKCRKSVELSQTIGRLERELADLKGGGG